MTACTWLRQCPEQGRHLVWRRSGLGDVETEVTCGPHLGDAVERGYRTGSTPGVDTELFLLSGSELREVADWVSAGDLVALDVPSDVADVVRQMRAASSPDSAVVPAASSAMPLPPGGVARAPSPPVDRPGMTGAPHLGPPPPGEGYGVAPRDAGALRPPTRGPRPTDSEAEDEEARRIRRALALAGVDVGAVALALMLHSCNDDELPVEFGGFVLAAARTSAQTREWAGNDDLAAAQAATSRPGAADRPPTR